MIISTKKTSTRTGSNNNLSVGLLSGLLLVLLAFASPVNAASITLNFIATATSLDAGVTTISIGDQFVVSLVVDDSVVDINASVGAGTFPGLATSFNMAAVPGNVGSWTPSGTFNLPGSNYVTNAFGSNITFQIGGSGFPLGGPSLAFANIEHRFGWPSGITDSGVGDTFAQQLGVPFGLAPASFFAFNIVFSDGLDFPAARFSIVEQTMSPPSPIPTLSLYSLMALALALAWFGWRKRSSKAST